MSVATRSKAEPKKALSDQEIQATYSRYQNDLQTLATKIGELESEAEEHELVLSTLNEFIDTEPNRKCFRLIGGVLVERTVKEIAPALKTNKEGILKVLDQLVQQYKKREEEFQEFSREHGIQRPGRP